MRHSCVAIATLLLHIPAAASAQELPTLPEITSRGSLVLLGDLAAIEDEGRSYPVAPDGVAGRAFDEQYTSGRPDRRCVFAETAPVRSGDFMVGGRIAALILQTPVKVWWAPRYNSRDMKLLVRGRRLDPAPDTARWSSDHVGFPVDPITAPRKHEDIDDWFFPSRFTLPSAGTWVIVATSGYNWGCFVLDVS